MQYSNILKLIESFYDMAKTDVMIGYHFRFIEDFETHIPRIANFWNLQLNGEVENKADLPFKLLEVHMGLGIKKGEMGRWIVLFKQNLEEFHANNKINLDEKIKFETKIEHFKIKIEQKIYN